MKKRILSILLAVVMIVGMIPLGTMTAFAEITALTGVYGAENAGTKANPYDIGSLEELNFMADQVTSGNSDYSTAWYRLTADINGFSKIIGNGLRPFRGHFDGAGHTVTLAMDNTDGSDNAGMFGYADGAEICNLTTAGHVNSSSWDSTGGICGNAYNTRITNCINKATVLSAKLVGGICGRAWGSTIINKCCNRGTVYGEGDCGGICGVAMSSLIVNCRNYATVTNRPDGEHPADEFGGIAGKLMADRDAYPAIVNCGNYGDVIVVNMSRNIGGLCGYIQTFEGSIPNIVYSVNAASVKAGEESNNVGGIIGNFDYRTMDELSQHITIGWVLYSIEKNTFEESTLPAFGASNFESEDRVRISEFIRGYTADQVYEFNNPYAYNTDSVISILNWSNQKFVYGSDDQGEPIWIDLVPWFAYIKNQPELRWFYVNVKTIGEGKAYCPSLGYTFGDIITINTVPGTGMSLKSLTAEPNDYYELPEGESFEEIIIDQKDHSFEMLAYDVTVTAEFAPPVATVPTAKTGLIYNGQTQTGVAAGEGYTLTGNTGKDSGTYTATATLESGYTWSDGSTDAKTIDWTIAKKAIAVPTITDDKDNMFLFTGEEIVALEENEYYTVEDGSATATGEYIAKVTLKDTDNYEWAEDFDGEIEWSIVSREKYNLLNEECEVDWLMARQGKITDKATNTVSDTEGRTIIPITKEQLGTIKNNIVVVATDGNQEFEVSVDCAYTWFYNWDVNTNELVKINAEDMGYAAFIIIDNNGKGGTITGFGYYRVYCDEIVDDSAHFLFDALYAAPNAK